MQQKSLSYIDHWIKTTEKENKTVANILKNNKTRLEHCFEKRKPADLQMMVETVMKSGIYAGLPNMDEIDSIIRLIRDTNNKLSNKLSYNWNKFIAYGADILRTDLTESQRLDYFAIYDESYNEILSS